MEDTFGGDAGTEPGPVSAPALPGPVGVPTPRPSRFPVRRWAPAQRPPGRPVLIAVGVAAVCAAGTVTLDRPGLGWLLTGVTLVSVAVAASAQFGVRPDPRRCLWGAAGMALIAVGTVRAAEWLYALCVPMAGLCAAQALVGGASLRTMTAGTLSGPAAVVRALPWAGRGVRLAVPGGRPAALVRLAASIVVSLLLLVVFGALFASADPAFARVLDHITPRVHVSGTPRWIVLAAVATLGGLGAAYLVAAPPELAEPAERRRPLRLLEWALPVAVLDALFTLFVLVQLAVLFGGRAHVLGPGGPNYAEYARGGFWQLLAVTTLTLLVVGVVAGTASRAGRADRVAIRVLVGALALLTLVIVASALKRMGLYEEVYGYTRLRLVVSAIELWLGLILVLVLVAGVRLRTRWLPRAVLVTAVAGLLALAAVNPDRFIARHDVDRFARTGRVDVYYLSRLSADAVPELARLPEPRRACALAPIRSVLAGRPDSWYSYNAGRAQARAVTGSGACPGW